MPRLEKCLERLKNGGFDQVFSDTYGQQSLIYQKQRYESTFEHFTKSFGKESVQLYSSPGRVELGGNHTDHNGGKVLAASIDLDTIAVVAKNNTNIIRIISEGFNQEFTIDLNVLDPIPEEARTTEALVRGVAKGLKDKGYEIGGFHAVVNSNIDAREGLSSSASFETLIGTILNHLYNEGSIPVLSIAIVSQFAENNYYGKPCGLMDQIACANGGIISIDFADFHFPGIDQIDYDFEDHGYTLVAVDTGDNNADLSYEYSAITKDMFSVANTLGKRICRQLEKHDILSAAAVLRKQFGERAVLRCLHFFNENKRVTQQLEALMSNNISEYFRLVNMSGDSSWKLLQNCYSTTRPTEQGITLALAVTEDFLQTDGACRVHGGGFSGAIQAYIPLNRIDDYKARMESIFGSGCVTPLRIRNRGTARLC